MTDPVEQRTPEGSTPEEPRAWDAEFFNGDRSEWVPAGRGPFRREDDAVAFCRLYPGLETRVVKLYTRPAAPVRPLEEPALAPIYWQACIRSLLLYGGHADDCECTEAPHLCTCGWSANYEAARRLLHSTPVHKETA